MAVIKPILDKVVLKVEKKEEATRNGIILAGKSKEEPLLATVVARGPGGLIDGKEVKMYIEAGDRVIVNKYAGSEITLDGQEYVIVRQSDILAHVV